MNLKRLEKILGAGVLLALAMKFSHIPMYGVLLILSSSILAGVYIYKGINVWNKEEPKVSVFAILGIALAMACIAVIFKFMYWPGGGFGLFLIALVPVIIALVISFRKKKTNAGFYQAMQIRLFVFLAFILFGLLVSRPQLMRLQHWNDPEMARLKIQAYDHPENAEFKKQYDEYRNKK